MLLTPLCYVILYYFLLLLLLRQGERGGRWLRSLKTNRRTIRDMVFTPLGKKVNYKLPVQNFATESLQEMDYMYYPPKTLTVCDLDNS